jgi:hypothetical protein
MELKNRAEHKPTEEEDSGAEETSDAKEENDETTSGSFWQQDLFTIKSWKEFFLRIRPSMHSHSAH